MSSLPYHSLQITSFHCFPACLEAFLKDNGVSVSQSEIVDRCPAIFAKGSNIEGAFSPQNIKEVAKEFDFDVDEVASSVSLSFPQDAVFIICAWEGKMGDIHWVRFMARDSDYVYFMN